MVRIAVTGSAKRRLPAERGTVTISVVAVGEDRADVVGRVRDAHAVVVAEAAEQVASGAATWWGAQDVVASTVQEWHQDPRGENVRVRRFRAETEVRVRFVDFAALGAWSMAVAERPDHEVHGIDWELTDSRRDSVISEVRADATRDALAKAFVYAGAAGLGSPRLVALYEHGLRPGDGGGAPTPMFARAMALDAGSAGGGIELRPSDIELGLELSADFEADAR